ncbi:MAG: hypothetical protein ACRD0V_05605 [Acidimicrobiales bacterium]
MLTLSDLRRDHAVQVLAWVRTALGVVAFVAPTLPSRPWVGTDAGRTSTRTLTRALGARDVALGLGTLLAQHHRSPVRGWLEASALADAGDVAATLADWGSRPRLGRLVVLAAAASGAVACGDLARQVRA